MNFDGWGLKGAQDILSLFERGASLRFGLRRYASPRSTRRLLDHARKSEVSAVLDGDPATS